MTPSQSSPTSSITAIIVAGGAGKRLGLGYNKVLALLRGVPILAHTVRNFEACPEVGRIIIVAGNAGAGSIAEDTGRAREIVGQYGLAKVTDITGGGATRMESVERGLAAAELGDEDLVVIQDGSRPFTPPDLIAAVITAAKEHGAAVCGAPPKDTIQLLDQEGFGTETFDRSRLSAIYTPLAARYKLLRAARAKARSEGYLNTHGFEDAALLQRNGVRVKIVPCGYTNIKITTAEDLEVAEKMLT